MGKRDDWNSALNKYPGPRLSRLRGGTTSAKLKGCRVENGRKRGFRTVRDVVGAYREPALGIAKVLGKVRRMSKSCEGIEDGRVRTRRLQRVV